jgi:WD40 repeat protein
MSFDVENGRLWSVDASGRRIVDWSMDDWRRREAGIVSDTDITALAIHPAQELIAVASQDGAITMWKEAAHKPFITIQGGSREPVMGLMFSADGDRLLSYSSRLRIFDTHRGGEVADLFAAGCSLQSSALLGRYPQRVVSGSDGAILAWLASP